FRREGNVPAVPHQLRQTTAELQCQVGHEQLHPAVLPAFKQFLRELVPIAVLQPTLQLLQRRSPLPEVHRSSVVRVDEAEVPELLTLIYVGYTRSRDSDERLG